MNYGSGLSYGAIGQGIIAGLDANRRRRREDEQWEWRKDDRERARAIQERGLELDEARFDMQEQQQEQDRDFHGLRLETERERLKGTRWRNEELQQRLKKAQERNPEAFQNLIPAAVDAIVGVKMGDPDALGDYAALSASFGDMEAGKEVYGMLTDVVDKQFHTAALLALNDDTEGAERILNRSGELQIVPGTLRRTEGGFTYDDASTPEKEQEFIPKNIVMQMLYVGDLIEEAEKERGGGTGGLEVPEGGFGAVQREQVSEIRQRLSDVESRIQSYEERATDVDLTEAEQSELEELRRERDELQAQWRNMATDFTENAPRGLEDNWHRFTGTQQKRILASLNRGETTVEGIREQYGMKPEQYEYQTPGAVGAALEPETFLQPETPREPAPSSSGLDTGRTAPQGGFGGIYDQMVKESSFQSTPPVGFEAQWKQMPEEAREKARRAVEEASGKAPRGFEDVWDRLSAGQRNKILYLLSEGESVDRIRKLLNHQNDKR